MSISTLFITELERAVRSERIRAAIITHDRFRGLPMDTTSALSQITNPYAALTPNSDGEFLHAA